jgi:hypothetical protein
MPRHFVTDDDGPACGVPYKAIDAAYVLSDVSCQRCRRTKTFTACENAAAREQFEHDNEDYLGNYILDSLA